MEFLNTFLPVILYLVAIILLIVLTIIGIKFIKILDKVDMLVENVEEKVNSFNGAVAVMSRAADGIAKVGDSVIMGISNAVTKIFNKKYKEEDYYE